MFKSALVACILTLVSACSALAACPGSLSAGVTIPGGGLANVFVRNSNGCALLPPGNSGAALVSSPPGLVTIAANAGGYFVVSSVAGTAGTGTLTASYPNATAITVPITVSGPVLELDTQ